MLESGTFVFESLLSVFLNSRHGRSCQAPVLSRGRVVDQVLVWRTSDEYNSFLTIWHAQKIFPHWWLAAAAVPMADKAQH